MGNRKKGNLRDFLSDGGVLSERQEDGDRNETNNSEFHEVEECIIHM